MYINYNNDNISCPFYNSIKCPINKCNYLRFPQVDNNLTVTTSEIVSTKQKIHEDLRIPAFHGNIKPEILQHINKNIENDILEYKRQMEDASEEEAAEDKQKGKVFTPFEISNSYVVTYNKNNVLSLSLIYQQVINKTTSYIRTTYNYDLKTGTSMSLKYLFIPNSNYLEVLNKKIREKLESDKNLYFPNSLNSFKGVAEDQPYYLDDKDIVIFFRFSEIAPIASDIPVIRLPYSELKDILKTNLLR